MHKGGACTTVHLHKHICKDTYNGYVFVLVCWLGSWIRSLESMALHRNWSLVLSFVEFVIIFYILYTHFVVEEESEVGW